MESVTSERSWGKRLAPLAWVGAFLPAVFILAVILEWRVRVPYHDSWSFVREYQDWCEGNYGWRDFLAPHDAHPSAVGKAVYFLVLRFARGDVGLLPLLSWTLSVAISIGVLVLSRPLWRDSTVRGAGLMFVANLSIFTAMQGHAWLWDFVFQNFIPGTCLVLGLLALSGARTSWWRWTFAGLLALISTFAFGTGFAVGFLLLPAAGMAMKGRRFSPRVPVILFGAIMCGAVGWLALNAFGHASGGSSPANLLSQPGASIYYILAVLGHTLGRGTVMEPVTLCAVFGAILLTLFFGCAWVLLRSRDRALLRQSWPWVAFCLWAMLNAAAICVGRFRANLDTGLAHRYATFMLFMPLGVLMLAVTTMQHRGSGAAGGWMRKVALFALALLLAAQALSWTAGVQGIELFHRRMASRKASLDFINVLPAEPAVFWHLERTEEAARGARFLMESGRLRDVVFAREATITSFSSNPEVSSKWANWRLVPLGEGLEEMRGVCGLSKDLTGTPDLILITATVADRPETVIALVPPEPPEDFFEHGARRRQFYEHYFGWRWPVDRGLLPSSGDVTLRAYAYDGARRKVRLIRGEAVVSPRQP